MPCKSRREIATEDMPGGFGDAKELQWGRFPFLWLRPSLRPLFSPRWLRLSTFSSLFMLATIHVTIILLSELY